MSDNSFVVQNIINSIKTIKKQQSNLRGVCILLGAGADLTSGGKTFRTLKMDLLKENNIDIPDSITDKKLTEKFDNVVERFTLGERCAELENIMRKHCTPSEGYELLVFLAQLGFIDAVITTNFDILLEETERSLFIKPFEIFTPGRAIPGDFFKKRQKCNPIYLKMHGDLYGQMVTHLTRQEITSKAYGEEFINLVEHIIQNYLVISIGYGGYDDLLTSIFRDHIDKVSSVYWCNIKAPETDSPLASLLMEHNKLQFIPCTFDSFFQKIGMSFLREQELPDTNPHFLPTVIKAKLINQQTLYFDGSNLSSLIERSDITNEILSFLATSDNVTILVGNAGMGKTSFIRLLIERYKEFSFMPIKINREDTSSILKCIANALGYKTDVPFSLLYNFSNWCDLNGFNIVFVMDEISLGSNAEDSIKYIKELLDFFKIIANYHCVKIVLCMDTVDYENMKEVLGGSIYESFIDKPIYVNEFTINEMKSLLKGNEEPLSSEAYELLRKPYIWGLVSNSNMNISNSLDNCIDEYIETTILRDKKNGLTKAMLQVILENIAKATVSEESQKLDDAIVEHLQNCNIIDSNRHFIYQKYTEYYYYKYIMRQTDSAEYIFDTLCATAYLQQQSVLSACAKALADVDSAGKLEHNLLALAKYVNKNTCTNKYGMILVYESIKQIQQKKYECLLNYLSDIDIQQSKLGPVLDIICYTAMYAPKDPYKILNLIMKNSSYAYNAFIIKEDYISNMLLRSAENSNLSSCIIQIKERLQNQESDLNFIELLFINTTWGPDNVNTICYNELVLSFRVLIHEFYNTICSEASFKTASNKIKQYSYNILFNSGNDVEEKFHEAIYHSELRSLYQKISAGAVLKLEEYIFLTEVATDINNVWTFLICNFISVLSMQNDYQKTYTLMQEAVEELGFINIVPKLDFYLSSVFMALYICQKDIVKNFNHIFECVVNKYEVQLFNLPDTRLSTLQKFTDVFEMNFEDGFNPMAFYFYVAPSPCFTDHNPWENGDRYLKKYWELADKLEQFGHYNEILRIVHALGQMISIYPAKGYDALEKMANYQHDIIKKGVERILKENYLRYPTETKHFIMNTHFKFSEKELLDIKSNRDPRWCYRALEQLHWCRFFVNTSNIIEQNSTHIFMKNLYLSDSYSSFIISFFKELFS